VPFHPEARQHQDAGGDRQPEREHVHHRECHVACSDLKGDQEVSEQADHHRHDGEEDHEGRVHGEEAVIELRLNHPLRGNRVREYSPKQIPGKLLPRESKLPAEQQCQPPSYQQEEEGAEHELNADDLVIDREDILLYKAHLRVGLVPVTIPRGLMHILGCVDCCFHVEPTFTSM
jgi:hypothetical protein